MTPDKRVEEIKNIVAYEVLTKDGQVYLSGNGEQKIKQALTQHHQDLMSEVVERIKERIEQSNMIIEELEKGNDLNGGDIEEQFDHEISAKIVLESLLQNLT